MTPQTFVSTVSKSLENNTFTHLNYVFIGWNKQADGLGDYYINKQRMAVTSNMELHAQWANPEGNGQPCASAPTVTDISKNTYQTVQIGNQCWMRENLRTTKYRDGQDILLISDPYNWFTNYLGAMCFYDDDSSNAFVFGALYNGYAVKSGKLCPEGWHIPSEAEWNVLAQFLGGSAKAGYYLKALEHWLENNANNESSFTAYPAGARSGYDEGRYYGMGDFTAFWSSTSVASEIRSKILIWNKRELGETLFYNNIGLSVRCIKD